MPFIDTVVHRWLQVPYALNVRYIRRSKRPKTTFLLIHGLGDTGDMWQPLIEQLPETANIVAIDLLGFGDSPKPAWGKYDARMQARSLLSTYLKLRIRSQVTVVGHSLGSLVAIDFARRYPLLTKSLILCSPPIYKRPGNQRIFRHPDDMLRMLFSKAADDPDRLIQLYALAKKIGVANQSLAVDAENVEMFVATLRASIINQATIDDVARLRIPITILHGLLDPFVIRSNLTRLAKDNPSVSVIDVPAGHILTSAYTKKLVELLGVGKK